jgi:hypothetical protein
MGSVSRTDPRPAVRATSIAERDYYGTPGPGCRVIVVQVPSREYTPCCRRVGRSREIHVKYVRSITQEKWGRKRHLPRSESRSVALERFSELRPQRAQPRITPDPTEPCLSSPRSTASGRCFRFLRSWWPPVGRVEVLPSSARPFLRVATIRLHARLQGASGVITAPRNYFSSGGDREAKSGNAGLALRRHRLVRH